MNSQTQNFVETLEDALKHPPSFEFCKFVALGSNFRQLFFKFPWKEEVPIFHHRSPFSSSPSSFSSSFHVMPYPQIANSTLPVLIVLYRAYREGEINRSLIAARKFRLYSVPRPPNAGGAGVISSTIPASPELRL